MEDLTKRAELLAKRAEVLNLAAEISPPTAEKPPFWAKDEKKDEKSKEDGDITRFERNAHRLGYIKKPTILTEDQKVIRGAVVSFLIMSIILFFDWISPYVIGNVFVGTWQDVIAFGKLEAIIFTQVVLAKIKQAYAERQKEK